MTHNLRGLYGGSDALFIVPEYQRDYSWQVSQVEELWDDLYNAFDHESEYYMGVLVLVSSSRRGQKEYEVVDGQQRLATFSVLSSVLRSALKYYEKEYVPKFDCDHISLDEEIETAIYQASDCIVDKYNRNKQRLKLNKKDDVTYVSEIIQNSPFWCADEQLVIISNDKRLVKAKKILSQEIKSVFFKEPSFESLKRLMAFVEWILTSVFFVNMTVESGYDAYLLFESLNSKGLDLTVSDLLKNKFLQLTDKSAHDRVLENWERMMGHLKTSRISNSVEFLRMYWCAFEEKTTNKALYKKIRTKVERTRDVEGYVGKFEKLSRYYAQITDKECVFPTGGCGFEGGKVFSEINTLGYSICYPLFMYAERKKVDYTDELAQAVLVYLFRVISIAEYSVGKADKVMAEALELLKKNAKKEDVLSLLRSSTIGDDEFKDAFCSRIYSDTNLPRYILTKYHLAQNNNEVMANMSILNVEHILPQKNDNWKFDHKGVGINRWVNHIGNMTLINEISNRKAYNKVFKEKVKEYRPLDAKGGTSFAMTNELFSKSKEKKMIDWTAEEITSRAEALAEEAVKIWKIS